jgi:uncharacterized protein
MHGSCLYVGKVFHRRLRPRRHELTYRVFYMLLDIDELPELGARSRLFAHNRFGIFSFHDCDHGARDGRQLRPWIERQLTRAGIEAGGRILSLSMPRVLGYTFNPITVYLCHDGCGNLVATLYEVSNTFGDRHSYLVPVADGEAAVVRQTCAKAFFVSPFIAVAGNYEFTLVRSGDRFGLTIRESDADGPLLTASFAGVARSFTDAALLNVFLTHPLLTLKVVAGIHWEALRLWMKGVHLVDRPRAPANDVTIVAPATTQVGVK